MTGDDYAGIVMHSDGTWYKLGRDGWPLGHPLSGIVSGEPNLDLDHPVIDADPVSVTDVEARKELG
ncbi:hypothetical protein ABZ413_29495 [Nocardia rhamnosiphila]|uniref:hypothetical protein n=1 Tax=Nocardia rhamnosiphila TaxID=426716 RepID=UPI0033F3F399